MAKSSTSTGAVEKVAKYRRRARWVTVAGALGATVRLALDRSMDAVVFATTLWAVAVVIWIVTEIAQKTVSVAEAHDDGR